MHLRTLIFLTTKFTNRSNYGDSIGSLIRRRLDEKGYSVVWLARQLACSRTNVYKIFEKPHIDTDMLARISTVLDYDFFILLSKSFRNKEADAKA